MSLGSIYESSTGPKGRDLVFELLLPPEAVGRKGGVRVEVPERLVVRNGFERATRVNLPQEDPGTLLLHLPGGFVSGSALRLRGYGEAHAQGQPGDLYLKVEIGPGGSMVLFTKGGSLSNWSALHPSRAWGVVILGAIASVLAGLALL